MKKPKRKNKKLPLLALTLWLGIPFSGLAAPATPGAPAQQLEEPAGAVAVMQLAAVDHAFQYRREGRPDPFLPFIPEKIMREEEPHEELTGMRRFEPGQLSLVSIVFTNREALAMVEDSVGRGYIIREGTKIGRTGRVADIVPNQVVINQSYTMPSGEERYKTVEMVLRKEGEKSQ